ERAIPSSNIDLHYAHCSRNLVKCKICDEMVPRKYAEEHYSSTHAPVSCSLCNETMEREILPVHTGEKCPKRIVTCDYCEFPLPVIDLFEHQEVCGNRTELCHFCNKYIRLREKVAHDATCNGVPTEIHRASQEAERDRRRPPPPPAQDFTTRRLILKLKMATFELYRRSTIGMCLTETLDEMVSNGVLTPELAIQVLVQFDKSMTEALDSQVKSKVTIKGHLHTYRFCDNVWTFIVQDAIFKYDEIQENVGQVKIVACDSKLLTQKWFVPSFYPPGTTVYKKTALRTPFVKVKDDGAGNGKCLLNEMSHMDEVEKSLRHRYPCSSAFFPKLSPTRSRKKNNFSNIYAMLLKETHSEMVGEKSCSIRYLGKEVPAWIRFPASIVLPFGVFEKVLSEDINKEVAKKLAFLREDVDKGDISKLKTIQETVMQMKAPRRMSIEVRKKMKNSRIPWPRGSGDDTWNRFWQAIKKVWASKWNERAYINCRRTNMSHDKQCIGILIQEYIRPDYSFLTYTNHPVSRDSSEIYTEIVKGSVETLVGTSLGRAMSSVTKKSDLQSPTITGYPNKSTGFYTKNKRSIIFRPDFISENTNAYTGNGIYDSLSMENKEEAVLDYSKDPMVNDLRFQALIHSKIAETAKTIEDVYGCAQDIEGVVQDGEVYVLQCKPLIL
ncbi:alpha-glucan water dikinase 2-like protein isoform X2, partial [Tanacetum coccineum]